MTARSGEGFTPLHYAAKNDCLETTTLLVDNNAEIDPVKYVAQKFHHIAFDLYVYGCWYYEFLLLCMPSCERVGLSKCQGKS